MSRPNANSPSDRCGLRRSGLRRSPRLVAFVASLAVMAGVAGACSGDEVTATGGGNLAALTVEGSAPPGSAPADTTPSTEVARTGTTVEIATANACEIEVVAEKGIAPIGAPHCDGAPDPIPSKFQEPVANGTGRQTNLPEIPRAGFSSAGVRRTSTGWAYTNPTYFKNPMTFLVVAREDDWLKVRIPARPNEIEGWVRAAEVTVSTTDYRMELMLADHHLVVYKGAEVIADTKVVIGTPGTPTPTGRFYVNDKEKQQNAGGSYGPWALSTSAYSEALDLFDGGMPVIAFHGTNQPGLIGTASSNGCVRMPNDVVEKLAAELPLGTPIDIR